MALPPDPITGVPRPCVVRILQNLMGLTLPGQLRNLVRFTGDTLYPHHDKLQNLFPLLLTAVARRGRPMRAASESGAAQRGGAARAGTTAHNWETQARKDSGGDVPFSDHPGPGRPGRRGSRVRFCAPDARCTSPIERHWVRARRPGDFLGTFVSLQKYLARGRNISSPSSRPQAKLPRRRRPQGAALRAGRPEAAPYEALSQPVCRGRRPRRPLIEEP